MYADENPRKPVGYENKVLEAVVQTNSNLTVSFMATSATSIEVELSFFFRVQYVS